MIDNYNDIINDWYHWECINGEIVYPFDSLCKWEFMKSI